MVDVVHRRRVAHRQDQVPGAIERDRVEVVRVPQALGRNLRVRRAERDVVERMPLEQHETGTDVDLLHDRVDRPAPHAGKMHGPGRGDVRVALGGDEEFVRVLVEAVGGLHGRDLLVVAVVDDALAPAVARVGVSLPPREHRLPEQVLHPEVGDRELLGYRIREEPDDLAVGVEDQGSVLNRSVSRRDEDVAGRSRGRVLGHGDRRRLEIRTRLEVLHAVRIRRHRVGLRERDQP